LNLTLQEFQEQSLNWNNEGRARTQKHQEVFPAPKKDEKGNIINNIKGGKRYHAAGTDAKCPYCKKIIEAHDKYMGLQKDAFGLTGIPFESMISAIKITVGVIRMMENGLIKAHKKSEDNSKQIKLNSEVTENERSNGTNDDKDVQSKASDKETKE